MKRLFTALSITFLLLLAYMPAPAHAQLGLKGGVNLSEFIGPDSQNARNVMGLQAGISLQLIKIGPLSIVPEVFYAEKGTRLVDQFRELQNMDPEQPVDPEEIDLDFKLAYVEVPVLAKLELWFLSSEVVHPYLAGGPVYGFRMDCSFTLTDSQGIEQQVDSCADEHFSDLEATFEKSDRGYVLGTGIDFQIPYLGVVTLDGRYYRGLSRLRKGGENSDVYNRNFTLMLGYSLGL